MAKRRFAKVPECVIHDRRLPPTAVAVYAALYLRISWRTKRGSVRQKDIAADCGLSLRHVTNAIHLLAATDHIEATRRIGLPSLYRFVCSHEMADVIDLPASKVLPADSS